jgi:hypothetical protein
VPRACENNHGKVAENTKKKGLERNDGFSTLCKINSILRGNGAALGEEELAMDNNDVTLFKCAPF